MIPIEEIDRKIGAYPARPNIPIPPTGTAEKFIGLVGANVIFHLGTDQSGRDLYRTSYDMIGRLSLQLDSPEVDKVKAIFSRLTHHVEVMAFADPNYPVPDLSQPYVVPEIIQDQVNEGLRKLHAADKRIPTGFASFAESFVRQLITQGMPELAMKFLQTHNNSPIK